MRRAKRSRGSANTAPAIPLSLTDLVPRLRPLKKGTGPQKSDRSCPLFQRAGTAVISREPDPASDSRSVAPAAKRPLEWPTQNHCDPESECSRPGGWAVLVPHRIQHAAEPG